MGAVGRIKIGAPCDPNDATKVFGLQKQTDFGVSGDRHPVDQCVLVLLDLRHDGRMPECFDQCGIFGKFTSIVLITDDQEAVVLHREILGEERGKDFCHDVPSA